MMHKEDSSNRKNDSLFIHVPSFNFVEGQIPLAALPTIQEQISKDELLNFKKFQEIDNMDLVLKLPPEIVSHIFNNLDLTSIAQCAQVSGSWYTATIDPTIYQNLVLPNYNNNTIENGVLEFLIKRCFCVKKLDISNYYDVDNEDFTKLFVSFLQKSCQLLTHLDVGHCSFVNHDVLNQIALRKYLRKLTLKITSWDLSVLSKLTKLVTLNLSYTNINDDVFIKIINSNHNLKHLNINMCKNINKLDVIVNVLVKNHLHLVSWSSKGVSSLTHYGATEFSKFKNLMKLNLEGCLTSEPKNCLEKIAIGCSNIEKLIVSEWQTLNDKMFLPVALHSKKLKYLAVSGTRITNKTCEKALSNMPKLLHLDIMYCDIQNRQVDEWHKKYPNVNIQHWWS